MYEGEQDYGEIKLGYLYRFLDLRETMDLYDAHELKVAFSNIYNDYLREFPGW